MAASSVSTLPSRFVTTDGRVGVLRPLNWDDLDSCLEFARGLAEEYAADINHGTLMSHAPTMDEEREWLEGRLASVEKGDMVSVAAVLEGTLVGNSEVARGRVHDLSAHGTLGIAVARPFRGIGVGSAMLMTIIEECRRSGYKTLELAALASNERAVRLYEKAGFTRVGVIPKKIRRRGVGFDELIMAMEL